MEFAVGKRKLASAFDATLEALSDFFYPPSCPFCDSHSIRERDAQSNQFCQPCSAGILEQTLEYCHRCGLRVGPYANVNDGCSNCRKSRLAFDGVIRLGEYDGLLRKACIRAKGSGRGPLAATLAELLWQEQSGRFDDTPIDVVIPVPQHWIRRITSTHNAPDAFGCVLANNLKAEFSTRILAKSRWTTDQSNLTGLERRQNLDGAFTVHRKSKIAGRNVLLVDDIMTTGTTAKEAAKTLKRAGAKRVIVAVTAVVS